MKNIPAGRQLYQYTSSNAITSTQRRQEALPPLRAQVLPALLSPAPR